METTDQICGIGNYEGDEFNWNSQPEECMPNCQTNAFHKSFYRPYESLSNDLPNGNAKGKSLVPQVTRSYPEPLPDNSYIPIRSTPINPNLNRPLPPTTAPMNPPTNYNSNDNSLAPTDSTSVPLQTPDSSYMLTEPMQNPSENSSTGNAFSPNDLESDPNRNSSFTPGVTMTPPAAIPKPSNNSKNPIQHIPKKDCSPKPPKRPFNE